MRSLFVATTLALAVCSAQAAEPALAVKPLVGVGVTFGGDTLATVQFSNAPDENIKSGGLVHLYGGAEFTLGSAFALQATIGYHVDDTSAASNGSVRFSRYPVDLVVLYSVSDRVRLGAGIQQVNSAKLAGSGVASSVRVDFDNSTGVLVEGEYLFSPKFGAKARFVSHTFKPKGGGASVDGNHFGLMLNYYF